MSQTFDSGHPYQQASPPPPPPAPYGTQNPARIRGGDPTKLLVLTWGTWRMRYLLGLIMALLCVLQTASPLKLGIALLSCASAAVLLALAAIVVPATVPRRLIAASLAIGPLAVLSFSTYSFYGFFGFIFMAALAAAWTTARHRHIVATLAAGLVAAALTLAAPSGYSSYHLAEFLTGALDGNSVSYDIWRLVEFPLGILITVVPAVWIAYFIDRPLQKRAAARRTEQAAFNENLQGYTTAYGLSPAPGTNGLAIAALITVFFVNIAGLILGHVALSQIKRTGQDGHGLALAAVIIGWVYTAALIAVGIWLVFVYSTAASSFYY